MHDVAVSDYAVSEQASIENTGYGIGKSSSSQVTPASVHPPPMMGFAEVVAEDVTFKLR